MAKFLLALDQSTQTTGYALFENDKLIKSGCYNPSGDYLERIVRLREWVKGIIEEHIEKNNIIEIAIEDIQLQEFEPNSGKRVARDFGVVTFKKLAYVQGALLSLFELMKINYQVIPSNTWKSYCKIAGRRRDEQKKNAQEFIQNTYAKKVTQDEADAICIGHCALQLNKAQAGFDWS